MSRPERLTHDDDPCDESAPSGAARDQHHRRGDRRRRPPRAARRRDRLRDRRRRWCSGRCCSSATSPSRTTSRSTSRATSASSRPRTRSNPAWPRSPRSTSSTREKRRRCSATAGARPRFAPPRLTADRLAHRHHVRREPRARLGAAGRGRAAVRRRHPLDEPRRGVRRPFGADPRSGRPSPGRPPLARIHRRDPRGLRPQSAAAGSGAPRGASASGDGGARACS